MQQRNLARLIDEDVRKAFENEARDLTPWLAENLDRLGDAVGFGLEHVQTQAAVGGFWADIHARCPQEDAVVLIENQLTTSDHDHLGKILTYLAGLEAKRIVWVARDFREEHLSAIKWLNEHTPSEFGFFAVKLRVVKIADSPLAPLFEVVEQPNKWERELNETARAVEAVGPHAANREKFWAKYAERYSNSLNDKGGGRGSNRWRSVLQDKAVISYYLAVGQVGLFLRPRTRRGISYDELADLLEPYAGELEKRLGVADLLQSEFLECNYTNEAQFERIAAWLHERVDAYEAALNEIVAEAAN